MRVILFFFSSRRRHTRYWRDWSSDVCSSDLAEHGGIEGAIGSELAEGRSVEPDLVAPRREIADPVYVAAGVQGGFEHESVGPGAPGQGIVAHTAIEPVVVQAAFQRVVAGLPDQDVVAVAATQHVIAVQTIQVVVASEPVDGIVSRGAPEGVWGCCALNKSHS